MSIESFFKDTCTFQLNVPAQNATSGQWEDSWGNVALLTGLKCRIEPIGGGLMGSPTKVYEDATHTLFMRKPSAPTITTKDYRVVISGNSYTILLVQDLSDDKEVHHLELVLSRIT